MDIKLVFRVLGKLYCSIGIIMIAILPIDLIYGEPFIKSILICSATPIVIGIALIIFLKSDKSLGIKEGIGVIVFGWISVSFFSSLFYIFSGSLESFTDVFFESVSGFTTTGASVISDIESLPKSVIFWRSMTHWIGGIGIVMFALMILPILGGGGMRIYQTETSNLGQVKFTPRIVGTVRIIFLIYLSLTALETILLTVFGMPLFDAIIHSFGTVATGGFSSKNLSIGEYNNLSFEITIIIFMILSGINYIFYFNIFRRKIRESLVAEELRFYLIIILISSILVIITLRIFNYESIRDSIRYGVFQVVSLNTTTGFTTSDYNKWNEFSQIVLIGLMLIGACPGSTSGAIKNIRILVIIKSIYIEIKRILHPQAELIIKIGGTSIRNLEIRKVKTFVTLYLLSFFIFTLIMLLTGLDLKSAFSSVAATLGGVGPGLGMVGPAENYASIPIFGKWVLCLCMFLGRLEFYSFFIILLPEFWSK